MDRRDPTELLYKLRELTLLASEADENFDHVTATEQFADWFNALDLSMLDAYTPIDWQPQTWKRGAPFTTSTQVAQRFAGLASEPMQQFHVVLLDAAHHMIEDHLIARGSPSGTPVDIRAVLHLAIRLGADSMILVHNHPSGNPNPSADDIEFTRRMRTAARAIGMQVLDHVIVARAEHFSFLDAHLMNSEEYRFE